MRLVFIIFGLIILASFITGVVLTVREKKKNKTDDLTDDPRILFSVDEDKAIIIKDGVVKSEPENDRFNITSSEAVETDSEDRFVVSSPENVEEIKIVEDVSETNNNDNEEIKSQTRFICNFDDEEII